MKENKLNVEELEKMYKGIANSPRTALLKSISSDDTEIEIEDTAIIPNTPNILVIGSGEAAETILVKSISGNILTVDRALEGKANIWEAGELLSRNFTNKDLDTLQKNILLNYNNVLNVSQNLDDNMDNVNKEIEEMKEAIENAKQLVVKGKNLLKTSLSDKNIKVEQAGEVATFEEIDKAIKKLYGKQQNMTDEDIYIELNEETKLINTVEDTQIVNHSSTLYSNKKGDFYTHAYTSRTPVIQIYDKDTAEIIKRKEYDFLEEDVRVGFMNGNLVYDYKNNKEYIINVFEHSNEANIKAIRFAKIDIDTLDVIKESEEIFDKGGNLQSYFVLEQTSEDIVLFITTLGYYHEIDINTMEIINSGQLSINISGDTKAQYVTKEKIVYFINRSKRIMGLDLKTKKIILDKHIPELSTSYLRNLMYSTKKNELVIVKPLVRNETEELFRFNIETQEYEREVIDITNIEGGGSYPLHMITTNDNIVSVRGGKPGDTYKYLYIHLYNGDMELKKVLLKTYGDRKDPQQIKTNHLGNTMIGAFSAAHLVQIEGIIRKAITT